MARQPAATLRWSIVAIFVLGAAGSLVELLLLGHDEDPSQFIPLVLLATSLVVLAWTVVSLAPLAVRLFQVIMVLFVLAGPTGTWLHFKANREFQLEVNPSLAGWNLVVKSLQAKAPPALAPGVMIQLGLLGLAYTYRHPHLEVAEP